MVYRDAQEGKRRDRERFRRRTADRVARGLCPTCGKVPPAKGRRQCKPCGERRRAVERARDAKRRAAGKPRPGDREKARARARERSRERAAERTARGLCTVCGREPAEPGRAACAPCAEKRRERQRQVYAVAKAAGALYGGRDPEARRETWRRRRRRRRAAGVCVACGERPPEDGGEVCAPCRVRRRAAERALYAARRAAGRCVRCGVPTADGGPLCGACAALEAGRRSPERKNAAARRRYAERRAAGRCTSCNAPSHGMSLCAPCARHSYERSARIQTMPVHPPRFAVFLLGADECLAVLDDEMEVAGFLAFAKLAREQVEVVADAPALASFAAHD